MASMHIKRPPNSRCAFCSGFEDTTKNDHPRDQAGKYLYYAGTFWLYLQRLQIAQRDFGERFMCV